MRKLRYILLYLMVISLGLPAQLTAATLQDVAGTYNVTCQIKLNVKGLVKDVSTDPDLFTLDDTEGTFILGDAEGTFSLDPKGKKILLEIDGDSIDHLESIFVEGIAELLEEKEGISPGDITCEIQQVKISPIKIDKKTNLPTGRFKVNIKGIASAFIPGKGIKQGKVSFKGKFTIGEPVGDDVITPVAGEWTGSAGVFDLSFTVDSTGTGITEITLDWMGFDCGVVNLLNGSRTTKYGTPLPITNGQFTDTLVLAFPFDPYDDQITIKGTFQGTDSASGTYERVVDGTICPGTWNASPVGSATTIDWVGTPRVEHGGSLTKKFYQSFVVSGPSGNVPITATCKNSSGSILDELTKSFPVEAGEEYEITVDATVLGLGRSPSPDSDDVIFSSSSASSSIESSIGDCTLTYDDVTKQWYYLCATDYSITDINILLVP